MDTENTTPERISRRDALRRGALLGGAFVWATPAVQVITRPAFASTGDIVTLDTTGTACKFPGNSHGSEGYRHAYRLFLQFTNNYTAPVTLTLNSIVDDQGWTPLDSGGQVGDQYCLAPGQNVVYVEPAGDNSANSALVTIGFGVEVPDGADFVGAVQVSFDDFPPLQGASCVPPDGQVIGKGAC